MLRFYWQWRPADAGAGYADAGADGAAWSVMGLVEVPGSPPRVAADSQSLVSYLKAQKAGRGLSDRCARLHSECSRSNWREGAFPTVLMSACQVLGLAEKPVVGYPANRPDLMLTLFPLKKPSIRKHGVARALRWPHLAETRSPEPDRKAARLLWGWIRKARVVALMPGSAMASCESWASAVFCKPLLVP